MPITQVEVDSGTSLGAANAEPETTGYSVGILHGLRPVAVGIWDRLDAPLLDPVTRAVRLWVRRHLALLREVAAVVADVDQADRSVELLTLIDSSDYGVRYKIYALELRLSHDFPELHFSFRVANLRDYSVPRDFSVAQLGEQVLYERGGSSDDCGDWLREVTVGRYAHTSGSPTTSAAQRAILHPV